MDPSYPDIHTEKSEAKAPTDTSKPALSEVARLNLRRDLAQLLFQPGALELDDAEVMSRAWREQSPSSVGGQT
jgi:hypothetical protein